MNIMDGGLELMQKVFFFLFFVGGGKCCMYNLLVLCAISVFIDYIHLLLCYIDHILLLIRN